MSVGNRKNILPGTIVFAIFGALGQSAYNFANSREGRRDPDKQGQGSWLNSRWSPVKVLSDDEYGKILEEKLLRLNVEIAFLDEDIESVKKNAPLTTTGSNQS